jgi:disulfide bond formation protein DsbB
VSRRTKSDTTPLFVLAMMGSIALLLAAFFFELVVGLPPCELCLWQRWPHAFAFAIGAVMLAYPSRSLAALGATMVSSSGFLGVYHTGIERGWWEGPGTCTADTGAVSAMTPDQLLEHILAAPVTRCSDVSWEFLTLSMASWNAILSLTLAAIWIVDWTRR